MIAKKFGAAMAVALGALAFAAGPAEAQESAAADSVEAATEQVDQGFELVYEREVFRYTRQGRADPFRSLLLDDDLGIRVEDLTLRGTVHHPDPSLSVAIMTLEGSERRIQARIGERVGPMRVLAIYPDRVDIVIEELGVARRETLRIVRPEQGKQGR